MVAELRNKRKVKILVNIFVAMTFLLLAVSGVLPRQMFADTQTDVQSFVTRFYQYCLNRDPDQGGLNYWVTNLQDGKLTGAQVAYYFIFSDEFINKNVKDEEFLNIMYKAFFNRNPDSSGYNYWLDKLKSGTSRLIVLAGFVNSNEFKTLCSSYGITPGSINTQTGPSPTPEPQTNIDLIKAFVTRFYNYTLDRDPDPSGLSYWVDSLVSGKNAGADLAYGFVFSKEFVSKGYDNTSYVTILYRMFFDREPDSGGLSFWVGELSNGRGRVYVLSGFVNSQEFKNLCSRYGIKDPGSLAKYFRNIVVMGDSQVKDPKWPEYLTEMIKQNFNYLEFTLYKSGVGGETIVGGYSRLSGLFGYKPSIFVIHYGTNDANGPRPGVFRTDPSTFKRYLCSMIDKIRKETGAMVVVVSTGPSYNRESSHPMSNLSTINYYASQACREKNAIYVDVFNAMKSQPDYNKYLSDGLHYNDLGSQFVAQTIYNTIRDYIK